MRQKARTQFQKLLRIGIRLVMLTPGWDTRNLSTSLYCSADALGLVAGLRFYTWSYKRQQRWVQPRSGMFETAMRSEPARMCGVELRCPRAEVVRSLTQSRDAILPDWLQWQSVGRQVGVD